MFTVGAIPLSGEEEPVIEYDERPAFQRASVSTERIDDEKIYRSVAGLVAQRRLELRCGVRTGLVGSRGGSGCWGEQGAQRNQGGHRQDRGSCVQWAPLFIVNTRLSAVYFGGSPM